MSSVAFGIAMIGVIWGIVSALVMTNFVSKRGVKINVPFFRIFVVKYIYQYSQITKEENGKRSIWFYSYIIAMNCALLSTVVGLFLK